jgi:hypothetical protein
VGSKESFTSLEITIIKIIKNTGKKREIKTGI